MKKLSHISEENKPQMVDVSKKDESSRVACAQTIVVFPEALSARFKDGDIKTKKDQFSRPQLLQVLWLQRERMI